jgi:hypothetical protein
VVYRARVRHEISPHRLTHRRRRLSIAQLRPPRILAAPAPSSVCSLCSPGLHCFSERFSPAGLHRRACDRDFTPAGPYGVVLAALFASYMRSASSNLGSHGSDYMVASRTRSSPTTTDVAGLARFVVLHLILLRALK